MKDLFEAIGILCTIVLGAIILMGIWFGSIDYVVDKKLIEHGLVMTCVDQYLNIINCK